MKCVRCNSPRIIRFVDLQGVRRIYCKNCHASYPEEIVLEFGVQKRLPEYKELQALFYFNPRATVRR